MSEVLCEGIIKIYRTGGVEVVALRGLDLYVRSGELRVIVGPSGSGKSTLISIIGGITRPDAGRVIVDGIDIASMSESELVRYRRSNVGIVFQFFNLIPTLTALENVELPMVLSGVPRSRRRERARELLRIVGLGHRMHHKPSELSGGEQQRVAIAAALANDSPLILADEPTGELDSVTGMQIAKLFHELNREFGKTMIIVTHDISMARIADRISRIVDGKIAETVIPAEMEVMDTARLKIHDRIRILEERKKQIVREIDILKRELAADKISPDEFVERYIVLKGRLKEIEEELSKLRI